MPHLKAEPLRLPFRGSNALSTHASYEGAKDAQERVGRQVLALLALYQQQGPLTDRDAAKLMNLERTTINVRRGELVKLGLVTAVDLVTGARGVKNVRWGLVQRE